MPPSELTATMTLDRLPDGVTMTVEVRMAPRLRFRLWVARLLLGLAAWVMGVGLDIELADPECVECDCEDGCSPSCSCG